MPLLCLLRLINDVIDYPHCVGETLHSMNPHYMGFQAPVLVNEIEEFCRCLLKVSLVFQFPTIEL